MKILHFSNEFGSPTLTFVYNEISVLSKKQDISISIATEEFTENKIFQFDNVTVLPKINYNRLLQFVLWHLKKANIFLTYRQKKFRRKLKVILNEFKPDIIHCHFGENGLKIWDNLPINNQCQIFIHFHGYDASSSFENSPIYVKRLKKLFKNQNVHPIFVSKFMLNNALRYDLEPDFTRILYYGTNTKTFQRSNYKSKRDTFLQISSFREKKGHQYTIEAFALFLNIVDNPSYYTLILAGAGDLLDDSVNLVNRLNLNDQVIFKGWVDHIQCKDLMEECSFFVHHSVTSRTGDQEGIPNAIMEAMAMEMPIISTIHSGIPELVQDGVNGYLVNEKDVKAYASRMIDILSWDYQNQNRQVIIDKFEHKAHCDELVQFYQSSVNNVN